MLRQLTRSGLVHVMEALREPEDFALRWERGEARYGLHVWAALALTAALGMTLYGMTMGLPDGPREVLLRGLKALAGAGLAWAIPLPAIYILNSLAGSRLSAGATLLAALVTVSWGGLAMLASIPINWFFTVALPSPRFLQLASLVVFTGVGLTMVDVFSRVMEALEPGRGRRAALWLVLVAAIGSELFYALGLFDFAARTPS